MRILNINNNLICACVCLCVSVCVCVCVFVCVCVCDRESIALVVGDISALNELHTGSYSYVNRRVAQAPKAFATLRKAVLLDNSLNFTTKRRVEDACVLSVLLHGAESRVPLRKHAQN